MFIETAAVVIVGMLCLTFLVSRIMEERRLNRLIDLQNKPKATTPTPIKRTPNGNDAWPK